MTTNQPDLDEILFRFIRDTDNEVPFVTDKPRTEAKEAILALIEKEKLCLLEATLVKADGKWYDYDRMVERAKDALLRQEQRLLLNGSKSKKEGKE